MGLNNLGSLAPFQTAFTPDVSNWFLAALSLSLAVQLCGAILIAHRALATPTLVHPALDNVHYAHRRTLDYAHSRSFSIPDYVHRGLPDYANSVQRQRRRNILSSCLCLFIDSGAAYLLSTTLLLAFWARRAIEEPVVLTAVTAQVAVCLFLLNPQH